MIERMKTSALLAVVLLLQIAIMAAIYGSHLFGIRASGPFGLAIWLLLPLVSSSLVCSWLLKGSAWAHTGGYPNARRASMSIGMPLLALFVGVLVCLNTYGE
jgi:hypothetical protein